jgi:hypothetical protein
VDRNPRAVPNPIKAKKVEKKSDYHLNWSYLWWLWMEREGGKEEKERRIFSMQRPASSFFSKEGATRIMKNGTHTRTDKTDNTQNGDNIEQVVARSTPVKRKCNLWMDLGNTSDLSTTESPAKRRRENFNCLLKYWDGGGG